MYRRKAFVHWYTGEGMDELEFVSPSCNALVQALTISLRPSPTCKTWFPSTCSTRKLPPTRSTTTRDKRCLLRRKRRLKLLQPRRPSHSPSSLFRIQDDRIYTNRDENYHTFLFLDFIFCSLPFWLVLVFSFPPLLPLFYYRLTRNCIPMSR